jgi:protein ImuA
MLPGSGLPLGSLIELLSDETSGALSVALQLSRKAIEGKAAWAVVDTAGSFYPLAAAQHGLDVEKLIVVRAHPARAAWAFSQLLRCPDVGASFLCGTSFPACPGQAGKLALLDNMTYRRLQLAAERGGGLGFVLRPAAAIRRPCWAAVRLLVTRASARTLTVTLLHVRGSNASGSVVLDVDS